MLSPIGVKGPLPDPIKGRIAVVGPCASGKTVLVQRLRARGYDARQCAQEHSYVAEMWQRLSRPEALVYLDVSLEVASRRRLVAYGGDYWRAQDQRLVHARQHCDICVQTDSLSEEQVLATVVEALAAMAQSRGTRVPSAIGPGHTERPPSNV